MIYPHTREEMKRRGRTDADLDEHLARVQLSYLLQREGGWDAIEDWIDVLSGGEKQRIAVRKIKKIYFFEYFPLTISSLADGQIILSSSAICHFGRVHVGGQRRRRRIHVSIL